MKFFLEIISRHVCLLETYEEVNPIFYSHVCNWLRTAISVANCLKSCILFLLVNQKLLDMSTSRSTKNEFLKMSQTIRSGTHCICVCQNCSRPKQRCKELCQSTGKSTITYNQILSKLKCCWILAFFGYFLHIGLILYFSRAKTWSKYLV